MADIIVGKQGKSFDISDRFPGYSRVVIRTGETDSNGNEIAYIAGSETGQTLEVYNPWANQTIANKLLERIQGFAYQPMKADSIKLPPAFELGDSVVVNNVFSGIYNAKVRFSSVFAGDIEAPAEKEINHEYQFEDSTERKYTRKINDAIARLNFYADSIEAKVDKVSAGSSFGWRLTENSWSVFNQQGDLFSINANGAYIKGEVQAGSGKIGDFTIGRGLSTNNQRYGGQEATGVYIGSEGIQLGTKFRVDNQGNLYAASGHFDGEVYASNILYGTGSGGQNYGYLPGGAISQYSLDTSQFAQGVRNSLDYANLFNSATTQGSNNYPSYFRATTVAAQEGMLSPEYYVYDAATNAAGSLKGHTHLITVSGNTVTLGAPDFSGTPHSFSKTGSATVQSIAINGTIRYENARNRFAVPVKATLSNGNYSTATIYVPATVTIGYDETYREAGWRAYYHIWAKLNGDEDWGASFNAYADTSPRLVEV